MAQLLAERLDIAMLDRDHSAWPDEEIKELGVKMTIMDGKQPDRWEHHDHS